MWNRKYRRRAVAMKVAADMLHGSMYEWMLSGRQGISLEGTSERPARTSVYATMYQKYEMKY